MWCAVVITQGPIVKKDSAQNRKRGRGLPPMDRKWLERSAVHYLQRYPATVARVREVMWRRIKRRLDEQGGDSEALAELLEELLERLQSAGHLDDLRQAGLWLDIWHRRGLSQPAMRAKLRQKGVSSEVVEEALSGFQGSGPDLELEAAHNYARRRRLGPYRRDPEQRAERRKRDLAALARSGFRYDVARRVIDAEEGV
jgi:regulatory protein